MDQWLDPKSRDFVMSQVVLVTGASRGIGRAIALKFKSMGWKVAACSSQPTIHEFKEADFTAVCDVTQAEPVREFVSGALKKLGRIDVVINNAGLAGSNQLDPSASDDLWHEIIAVNLNGTYYVTKHTLPHLPDVTGRVINIASVLALRGVPDQTAYCAAKHGVLGLTRALAHHLAPRKITVNAVCPGWTRTEMAHGRMKELGMSEASLRSGVPLGRFVEPEEVAAMAWYLASPEAGAITGQAMTIDGGSWV